MSFSRYSFSERKIDIDGKEYISVSKASYRVFKAVELGLLQCDVKLLEEGERILSLSELISDTVGDTLSNWKVVDEAKLELPARSTNTFSAIVRVTTPE